MKRGLVTLVLVLFGAQTIAFALASDVEIPTNIRNNRFFIESLRLNNLARLSYDEGNFLQAAQYAEEAILYANLSDEFVILRLKIMECDNAIAAARKRIEYADSVNAAARYPSEYNRAQIAFTEARSLRTDEHWDESIAAANRVLAALAYIQGLPDDSTSIVGGSTDDKGALPSQYTVRTWQNFKDCLWNIAGLSWVYNDPWQWKRLYDANKAKMPERDNPDLIHPNMVLDIPSIRGEVRQGMWQANREYPALP